MKTLLFTIEFPPFKGGVANYYENIIKYWPKPDEIFLLNNNDGKLVNKSFWPKWLPAFWQLYGAIKKHKIKHVIVGQILPLGTVSFYLAKFLGFKYTVVLHGMDLEYAKKVGRKKKMARKILTKSESIICNSNYVKELCSNFLNKKMDDKIHVVNPGIMPRGLFGANRVKELKRVYNPDNKFLMYTVSRLVKRKGHDMVIESLDFLAKEYSDIIYVIAGTGPDEGYLKEKAKDRKNIIFLGNISEKDKWAWFRACDVFVMPSRNIDGDVEGFGISFLEAAIAGKPVIAGRSGGTEDAVVDEETGILAFPESPEDIAEAIVELQKSWTKRYYMGQEAQKRALEEFAWPLQAEKFYEIINN